MESVISQESQDAMKKVVDWKDRCVADATKSLKLELARAEAVCRELRYLVSVEGGVDADNYGTLQPLLEHWLEGSTSSFKYERPAVITPAHP